TINRGTLALDFQRSAYTATMAASPGPKVEMRAAAMLARDERAYGSVARAEDLLASIPRDVRASFNTDYDQLFDLVQMEFDEAALAGDVGKMEDLLVR